MPGLVGGLQCEQLQHLPEVRVHAGEQPGRDYQRRLLVLDQVGHHLDDGGLHVGRQRLPVDDERVSYVAQAPGRHRMRMFTQVGRRVLPHSTAVGKVLLAWHDDTQLRRGRYEEWVTQVDET